MKISGPIFVLFILIINIINTYFFIISPSYPHFPILYDSEGWMHVLLEMHIMGRALLIAIGWTIFLIVLWEEVFRPCDESE